MLVIGDNNPLLHMRRPWVNHTLIVACLLMHPRARILILTAFRFPVIAPASLFVGLSVGLDLLMALFADDKQQVAWWADLGGFGAGMVLPLKHRDVALFQPAEA